MIPPWRGAAMTPAAIVVLGPAGLAVARRLVGALPGARLHAPASRVVGADVAFADAPAHLRGLFAAGTPIVGLMASGILVRTLASLLGDKTTEPPVIAVAADGSAVVPLLGGHHGANALARTVAATLGIAPAITTAGDVELGFALDEPPSGWRVRNPAAAKAIAARLLDGSPVALRVDVGDTSWLDRSRFAGGGDATVRVTDRDVAGDALTLVLHPPVLALGVGCERGAEAGEIAGLVDAALRSSGLAREAIACVATLDLKSDEIGVLALAESLGVPARFFAATELEEETPRLANPSAAVFAEVGCHGVAEAAALRAAGDDATLVVAKMKSARATCAIARAVRDIDPTRVGRGRGSLAVVGLGPGGAAWRTPEATAAIARASDLVGFAGYLDLIGPEATGKPRHGFALGEEERRVAFALDLAASGRDVALVCSGDPGIYAMASLVFETLDRGGRPDWRRPAVAVVPGVSAMQMAAARAGAVLGHDFCAVSLSDLMTPWPAIEARLRAAAAADFVVALYNPVSTRRREGLAKARDILLARRPSTTPVVLARNLGRDGERVTVTTLGALTPESADMLTTVIVGASTTRIVPFQDRDWVYTPRGYGGAP